MNKEIILFLNSLNTYLLKYVSINLLKSLKKKKKGYPKLNDQNRSPQFSSSIDKIKILLIRKVKGSTKFYTLSLSLSLQPLFARSNLIFFKTKPRERGIAIGVATPIFPSSLSPSIRRG